MKPKNISEYGDQLKPTAENSDGLPVPNERKTELVVTMGQKADNKDHIV